MKYLSEIIENAAKKAGNQRELENDLGLARGYLTDVKAGRRGLPAIAQDKLEVLMNLPQGSLRPASEIITEKQPEKVAYWKKKLVEFERMAAVFLMAIFVLVTTVVTPSPAKAAPLLQVVGSTVYIMLNAMRKLKQLVRARFASWLNGNPTTAAPHFCFSG